jgi:hypothetical protein
VNSLPSLIAQIKELREALSDQLAWVEHWQTDWACGLKPTLESLTKAEVKIRTILSEAK